MIQIGNLLMEDVELVISLPYRVGIWMSYMDDEDGEQDDAREMKALEQIISEVAKSHDKSDFVQEVARNTLDNRNKWAGWSQGCFDILPECEKALGLLSTNLGSDDYNAYKDMLIEIATVVAQAYGEFGDNSNFNDSNNITSSIKKFVVKFSGMSSDSENHPMNVSASENAALASLAKLLKEDK
jgi:hypothetical protein